MKDFNTYWKEKAQKRRKKWAALSNKYAEQHSQLEEIRQEVFMPLDYVAGIELDSYNINHTSPTFSLPNSLIKNYKQHIPWQ